VIPLPDDPEHRLDRWIADAEICTELDIPRAELTAWRAAGEFPPPDVALGPRDALTDTTTYDGWLQTLPTDDGPSADTDALPDKPLRCPICEGYGRLQFTSTEERCEICHGTGRVNPTS